MIWYFCCRFFHFLFLIFFYYYRINKNDDHHHHKQMMWSARKKSHTHTQPTIRNEQTKPRKKNYWLHEQYHFWDKSKKNRYIAYIHTHTHRQATNRFSLFDYINIKRFFQNNVAEYSSIFFHSYWLFIVFCFLCWKQKKKSKLWYMWARLEFLFFFLKDIIFD